MSSREVAATPLARKSSLPASSRSARRCSAGLVRAPRPDDGHADGRVVGAPRIGDAESGAAAAAFTPLTSVISGGLAFIAGALILARLLPAFRRQTAPATHPDPAPAAESGCADAV